MATKFATRRPDMSRNKDYAGKSVRQGGYTITYDQNGYARKASHDKGASATYRPTSSHANDSDTHRQMHDAASRGDWDEVGRLGNGLIKPSGGQYSTGDFAEGNDYINELQNEFGYNARDYYRNKHDNIYGKGTFDDPNFRPPTSGDGTISGGSTVSGVTTGGRQPSSIEGYLQQLYRDKAAAEEAALRSAFDSSMAGYEANDGKIGQMYDERRRQAEGANDLQRMSMNELGIAQGLNTGATGQLALGQSQAYQGMLGDLFAQENADRAANDLLMRQLEAQFNANLAKSQASNNADLTQALINEMIRQAEADTAAEKWAQEQANWQAEFDAAQKRHDDELKLAYAQLAAKGRSGGRSGGGGYSGGGGGDDELPAPGPVVAPTKSPVQMAEEAVSPAINKQTGMPMSLIGPIKPQYFVNGSKTSEKGKVGMIGTALMNGSIDEALANKLLTQLGY